MEDMQDRAELKSLKRLRLYMTDRQLPTAYAVAKAAGLRTPSGRVADGRVRHLVSGRRKTCRLDTALAITRALNMPLADLFVVHESPIFRDSGRAA